MNTENYDRQIVDLYLDKVAVLGVKALQGEDVKSQVNAVVQEAAEHFAIWVGGTKEGNLKLFAGQLGMRADLSPESQPECRDTFRYAAQLTKEMLENL